MARPPFAAEIEPTAPGIHVRFAATFLANLLRAVASFAGGAVVARALGADDYGDLNFLLASFAAFLPLLDAGTLAAFFTFLSRKRRGARFFIVFGSWLAVQVVVATALIAFLLPDRTMSVVWVGQSRTAVLLAFAYVFLNTQLWGAISRLGEARRLTLRVQGAAALQAIVHLAVVVVAAQLGWLTVNRTIGLLALEFALICFVLGPRLIRENLTHDRPDESWRSIVSNTWEYCRPLLLYCWVGVPYAFADRWLLQSYAGSTTQGHFSFASQFSTLSLLATSSILSVFWKEVVDAKAQDDVRRVRVLHSRVTRSLYFVAVVLSCAMIPYTAIILRVIVGPEFVSAAGVLALLLAYPVHQSLGQIQGTFLYASADTRTYATLGIVMMVISIPVTYALLAPRDAAVPGLQLGAIGLAVKMVALQIVIVNVQGWFIARRNGWDLDLWHQVLTFGGFLMLSYLARWASRAGLHIFTEQPADTIVAAVGSLAFLAVSVVIVLRWPAVAGASSDDLRGWRQGITARLSA